MKTWSKTILSVYKYLEALSNSIDNLVLKKSINSAFYSSYRFDSCYDVANKIMQLTERKINLINIKVMVDDTFESLPIKQRQLLALCYIDNIKSSIVADMMGISLRTFFRKKSEALNSFSKHMISKGYTKERIEDMFLGESWIRRLYEKNLELQLSKDYKMDRVAKRQFFNSVLKEFNIV